MEQGLVTISQEELENLKKKGKQYDDIIEVIEIELNKCDGDLMTLGEAILNHTGLWR